MARWWSDMIVETNKIAPALDFSVQWHSSDLRASYCLSLTIFFLPSHYVFMLLSFSLSLLVCWPMLIYLFILSFHIYVSFLYFLFSYLLLFSSSYGLPTYLPIYLYTYPPTQLSTYLPTHLSIYPPNHLYIYLSTYLPTYTSIYLPTQPPIYPVQFTV
jgi:hypothetical protein